MKKQYTGDVKIRVQGFTPGGGVSDIWGGLVVKSSGSEGNGMVTVRTGA
jgi:hypothetical protein